MDSEDTSRSRSASPEKGSIQRNRCSVRGRGQGRRGRTRRGQRRGLSMRNGHGRQQDLTNRAAMAEIRETDVQERINTLPPEQLRGLVMRMYQRQPSFVLDIIDVQTTNDNSNRPGSSCGNVPVWCTCTFCREMPVDTEKVCCNKTPSNCHSRLRDFDIIVLDELVLEVARRMREDMLVEARDQNLNRANRYAAYRQYILWIHGHLGAGNRRVIPSCVIWRIRDKYPDPFGHYVGFIDGRLG